MKYAVHLQQLTRMRIPMAELDGSQAITLPSQDGVDVVKQRSTLVERLERHFDLNGRNRG
jgi:hypothetical protein